MFKSPSLVTLPSFTTPCVILISAVPLLVKLPVMFRLFFVLPLNLAPPPTVRLPVISMVSPFAVRFPLEVMSPSTDKAPV
nr:hypothetical protein BV012_00059 [Haemophilus influenzae]